MRSIFGMQMPIVVNNKFLSAYSECMFAFYLILQKPGALEAKKYLQICKQFLSAEKFQKNFYE